MVRDGVLAPNPRCLCLIIDNKVSTIDIEGLGQAGGRAVAMASHREVPNVVCTELVSWASHTTKSHRSWRQETPYMYSYKSVKTAPLYAIPTPSLIFSPWLAMRLSACRGLEWNGSNMSDGG